ncbi:hypothetical protein [Streptomyces sp. NPDC006384]|uniref:hypothetical protein n=1 Tax=Streptomyces sp. NPDC006384 TaxID=3364745 RepID=UPI0036ACEB4C
MLMVAVAVEVLDHRFWCRVSADALGADEIATTDSAQRSSVAVLVRLCSICRHLLRAHPALPVGFPASHA